MRSIIRFSTRWLSLAVLCFSVVSAEAQTTIRVPADNPTIQGAIGTAIAGDTVLVSPGTYFENIDFLGKAITVASEAGPATTVIDGGQNGAVVRFVSGEGPTSVLTGFTVQNGNPLFSGNGGGIDMSGSSPTVTDNLITNNLGCNGGAGIASQFGSPAIRRNVITNNHQRPTCVGAGGGGISVFFALPPDVGAQITDNVISANTHGSRGGGIYFNGGRVSTVSGNVISGNFAPEGGGILLFNTSDVRITQNVIAGNSASIKGGGLYWLLPVGPILLNNTIADNDSPGGSAIFAESRDPNIQLINNIVVGHPGQTTIVCGQDAPAFSFNDVFSSAAAAYGGTCMDQTGLNGNVFADPLFSDSSTGDYHLTLGSPAIDAGTNTGAPVTDIEGNPRPEDGDGNGVAIVDMGAYEFSRPTPSQLLQTLMQDVMGLSLQGGTESSLLAHLNVAAALLDDLNGSNDIAAANALRAFVNHLLAPVFADAAGNPVPEAQIAALIATAEQIVGLLIAP